MNALGKFRITSEEINKYFWVYVYDSVEKLRLDAKKYKPEETFDKCMGVCQPVTRIVIEKGKKDLEHPNIGVIRLLNTAGSEVSAHEVLHASMWAYRVRNGTADFGDNCSDKEEQLCYIFGQFYKQLVTKMYKFNFWRSYGK